MEDIEVKKHREMIVVVSALVDEKDETQIHIEAKSFVPQKRRNVRRKKRSKEK